jgi:uncharacterized membrane protein YphA (DoxX/SURF4 family)
MSSNDSWSVWARFWHVPVRAERLALTRILLALALFTDQLCQYLLHFRDFFGPAGVAPDGLHDRWLLEHWRWTVLVLGTDNLAILYPIFLIWVGCTVGLLVGWHTRLMNVAVWFLTSCFLNRNPNILNGGDDTLIVGLFLLMLMPSGNALSLDALRWRRRLAAGLPAPLQLDAEGRASTPAWGVRVLQIQLCVIYLTTGLAKLVLAPGNGTWWDGTSIHYVLNNVTMSRWSFAQLPVPLWLTAPLTYVSVWWEVFFPLLVLNRWTRRWALWFGVLFHVGIWLTIEVGWFSFYTLALYGVWVPDEFWDWIRRSAHSQPISKARAGPSRSTR